MGAIDSPFFFLQIILSESCRNMLHRDENTPGMPFPMNAGNREDSPARWRRWLNLALLLVIPALMIVVLCVLDRSALTVTVINPAVTEWVECCGVVLSAASILYFIWVVSLAVRRYREVEPVSDAELPTCTVIVPAYNEGRHVLETLHSILAGDYPPDKLEIMAVNDGSRDDTWVWISRAAAESGGRIHAINLERNRGKRGAMHAGFLASHGEIVISIDSDSIILPDTLRRMVSPFVRYPEVGGVAGNVKVLNWDGGLIPKMLDVNFVFSFDLIRAAQSAVRAVFCSPGALTACRRAVVMPRIDEWVNQQFLGRPANIGEDRALTNLILKSGYAVVFQRSAIVLTRVPETYYGLSRMLIRWARSNIRENLEMLLFAFNFRRRAAYSRMALVVNLVMQLCWMVTPVFAAFLFLYCMIATLGAFLLSLLPVLVLSAVFPASVYFLRRGCSGTCMVYFYALFGFIAMFWIAPFALFSFHRSGWLTR